MSAKAESENDKDLATGIDALIKNSHSDLELLRSMGDLRAKVENRSAPEAMEKFFDVLRSFSNQQERMGALDPKTWTKRIETIEGAWKRSGGTDAFAQALKSSGPLASLHGMLDDLRAVETEIGNVKDVLRTVVAQILVNQPARAAAELPVPKGQTRVDLSREADTAFDLIRQPQRHEDDTVVVRYRFFHGEQQIGREQRDEFVLRVFGWHDRTVASLAFVQQDGEDTWEPTGALSWILSRRPWPSASDDGLAGRSGFSLFSGVGLTMMPLDFAEEQSAELGIALTLSFLDNRLLIGYGQDLQASTRNRYPFVSIRLLDTTRFLGTKIGGNK